MFTGPGGHKRHLYIWPDVHDPWKHVKMTENEGEPFMFLLLFFFFFCCFHIHTFFFWTGAHKPLHVTSMWHLCEQTQHDIILELHIAHTQTRFRCLHQHLCSGSIMFHQTPLGSFMFLQVPSCSFRLHQTPLGSFRVLQVPSGSGTSNFQANATFGFRTKSTFE